MFLQDKKGKIRYALFSSLKQQWRKETYKTWLYSISGNPLTGERTKLHNTFLSYNQMYPFIPSLQRSAKGEESKTIVHSK